MTKHTLQIGKTQINVMDADPISTTQRGGLHQPVLVGGGQA